MADAWRGERHDDGEDTPSGRPAIRGDNGPVEPSEHSYAVLVVASDPMSMIDLSAALQTLEPTTYRSLEAALAQIDPGTPAAIVLGAQETTDLMAAGIPHPDPHQAFIGVVSHLDNQVLTSAMAAGFADVAGPDDLSRPSRPTTPDHHEADLELGPSCIHNNPRTGIGGNRDSPPCTVRDDRRSGRRYGDVAEQSKTGRLSPWVPDKAPGRAGCTSTRSSGSTR